jgi:hypothetical protein
MSNIIWIGFIFVFIGFALGYNFTPRILDFIIRKSVKRGFFNGPWKTHLGVGRKQTSFIEKAAIARVGLGANDSDETIYWNAFTDSDGKKLNTKYNYEIYISSPLPVDYDNKGFWSCTVYGQDQYLMKNAYNKFMVRHDEFNKQEWPLRISMRKQFIDNERQGIPLSEQNQTFTMALRCYRPLDVMKQELTCKNIDLPQIIRIS